MSGKFQFSFLHRILLMLLLVALLPLLAIWMFNYQSTLNLTSDKVEQQLSASNNNLTTHVDGWVDMNQRMLLQNASVREIQQMQAEQQNPILETITKYYDWTYLAFTVDKKGMNVGRSDGKKPKYYGDRSYVKQVLEDGKRFGQQILIGKTSGKPALVLSSPVYTQEGRLNGVLAIAMTLTELSTKVSSSKIGQTGYSFLLDEKGEVIAHPKEEFTRSRVDMSNHPAFQALSKGKSYAIYADYDSNKVVAVAQKTKQGWVMITQQDYAEAYQQISAENIRAFILLAITVILVFVLALIATRRLTEPLRELTDVADQYSQGKLNLKISGLDRKDEIGQLAQAIERLGTSTRMAIERLRKQKQ